MGRWGAATRLLAGVSVWGSRAPRADASRAAVPRADASCARATCPTCAQVEVYADPSARGGVLEPDAVCEIKFRTPDLIAMMHRWATWWHVRVIQHLHFRYSFWC